MSACCLEMRTGRGKVQGKGRRTHPFQALPAQQERVPRHARPLAVDDSPNALCAEMREPVSRVAESESERERKGRTHLSCAPGRHQDEHGADVGRRCREGVGSCCRKR